MFYRRLLELSRASHDRGQPFEILNISQGAARIFASKIADAPSFFEQASAPLKSLNLDTRGNVTTFYAGLSTETLADLYGDGAGLSLGNIFEMTLEEMAASPKLERIMRDFATSKRACERSCEYFSVCSGGFDLLKHQTPLGFDTSENVECLIHVKTMVDALVDDIQEHLQRAALSQASVI